MFIIHSIFSVWNNIFFPKNLVWESLRALDSTPLSPILRLSLSESAMPQVLSTVKTARGLPWVVCWLKIHLPMQGTWVPSLIEEVRSHMSQATKPACYIEGPVQPAKKKKKRLPGHVCAHTCPICCIFTFTSHCTRVLIPMVLTRATESDFLNKLQDLPSIRFLHG